jgi:hypothetical protein
MDMSETAQVEAQAILRERIERYQRKRGLASRGDAIESLVRLGLFTDAMPDGATLIRRDGGLAEWREPRQLARQSGREPWDRALSTSDADIAF